MKQPTIDKALKALEEYFNREGFNEGTKKYVTSILNDVYDGGHCDGYAARIYDEIEQQDNQMSAIEDC